MLLAVRSRRLGRLLRVAGMVALTGLAPIAVPTLGDVARAGTPPFPAPESWSTICAARREAGTRLVRGTNCRWLSLDGVWRRYLVYVPTKKAFSLDRSWPVVLMFHGSRANGEKMLAETGWVQQAEAVGAIVVFPTAWRYERTSHGIGTRWNTWKLPSEIRRAVRLDGYPEESPYPARDLVFVRMILDDLEAQLTVNRDQVFGSGFSNGGKFVVRVGAALETRVASVTCGGFCDAPPSWFNARRNISILYALGTRDPLVLNQLAKTVDPDPQTVPLAWADAEPIVGSLLTGHLDAWALDPAWFSVVETDISTRVTWRRPAEGNRDGNDLRLLLFDGLSHFYPRADNNRHAFNMAAISWAYFMTHEMP